MVQNVVNTVSASTLVFGLWPSILLQKQLMLCNISLLQWVCSSKCSKIWRYSSWL